MLFDENLGGIYTMRLAGNYVDSLTRGACAYMVDDLNIKVGSHCYDSIQYLNVHKFLNLSCYM